MEGKRELGAGEELRGKRGAEIRGEGGASERMGARRACCVCLEFWRPAGRPNSMVTRAIGIGGVQFATQHEIRSGFATR